MPTEHSSDDPPALVPETLAERWPSRGSRRTRPRNEAGDAIDGIDWRRIIAPVRRFKWIVLAVTLAGTAAGVAAGGLLDPTYRARATLWIEVPDVRTRDQGPIQSAQLLGSTGWVDLLKSHAVLHEVVLEQRLYLGFLSSDAEAALATFRMRNNARPGVYRLTVAPDGATFTLATEDGRALQVGNAGDSVGAAQGFAWVPPASALTPGRTIQFSVSPPAAVAQRLAEQLRVQTDLMEGKVGNFIRVELAGPNAEHVVRVVNAIAERFVEVAADLKRQKLTALVGILAEQVSHAQRNLVAMEQALRDFRVGTVTTLGSDGGSLTGAAGPSDPAFRNFFDMQVTRDQLRRDIAALERVLAEPPDSGLAVDALEMTEPVRQSSALSQALKELTVARAELRALRYRYTEAHPPVRRVAEAIATLERQTIPLLLRGVVDQLRAREMALRLQLDSVTGGLRQVPAVAIQGARLRRDVTIAEQLFTNIQQRYEEARLAEVSSMPEVRILDRAVAPQTPLSDIAPALIAVAFLGSLTLGVLGVLVLDRVDSRVRYPEHVTEAMGLPILGAVPHVPRPNGSGENAAPVIEALRGIRLRVVHAHGTGPLVVTVTSPGGSDGKSFVTSNLALAFADAGYRTLLIDGDIRRGSLNRVFGVPRKPGLTELLAGRASREQVLRVTDRHALLSFIACGTRTQAGPELLTSAPMARLITTLRTDYDAIFVDTAPLAAGVDAYALGTMTNAMLLVLRTGVSNRELAEAKLEVLDRLPVRVLGAVLNDVRPGPDYRYYSYYLAGYELREEPGWAGRPVLGGPE